MKSSEFITEGISDVVYHYTPIAAAQKILQSGEFQLSSTLGSVEEQYAPKGFMFFLSTTRTRFGGYHDYVGSTAVLFTMSGRTISQHYPAKSVDYWEDRPPSSVRNRPHEAEDRIFSREPSIPIDSVIAIDVYVRPDADNRVKAIARSVLILAKQRGIKVNYYNDEKAWRSGDTRSRGDISILTGQDDRKGYSSIRHRGYLMPWIEVITGRDINHLSKKARELVRSLGYSYDKKYAASGLANDLSNARKPNSGADRGHAITVIQYMNKNGLRTVSELVDNLAAKWGAAE